MGVQNKKGADGSIKQYKARLVAQGFTQQFRADYDETFSPVARMVSCRVLIALSVQYSCKLPQVDVKTAFLNRDLEEEVYMKQPGDQQMRKVKNDPTQRLKSGKITSLSRSHCWDR